LRRAEARLRTSNAGRSLPVGTPLTLLATTLLAPG